MLGLLAERLRASGTTIGGVTPGVTPGHFVAWLTATGLLGTASEAGLLHFRGAFHNPAMVIPITAPPIASVLLIRSTTSSPHSLAAARWWLRLLIAIGFVGSAFHAYGIQRNMAFRLPLSHPTVLTRARPPSPGESGVMSHNLSYLCFYWRRKGGERPSLGGI